jgi:hypothetical protein
VYCKSGLYHLYRLSQLYHLYRYQTEANMTLVRDPACGEIPTQPAEPGQVDGSLVDMDRVGEPEATQTLAPGLILRVASLAVIYEIIWHAFFCL